MQAMLVLVFEGVGCCPEADQVINRFLVLAAEVAGSMYLGGERHVALILDCPTDDG
jgi:hypothetical protein